MNQIHMSSGLAKSPAKDTLMINPNLDGDTAFPGEFGGLLIYSHTEYKIQITLFYIPTEHYVCLDFPSQVIPYSKNFTSASCQTCATGASVETAAWHGRQAPNLAKCQQARVAE